MRDSREPFIQYDPPEQTSADKPPVVTEPRSDVVTVERRSRDFIAFLNGDRKIWDCGKTRAEAIGNLVITHRDLFNVTLEGDI